MSPHNRSWDCLERGRGGWGDAINNARGTDHEKTFPVRRLLLQRGAVLLRSSDKRTKWGAWAKIKDEPKILQLSRNALLSSSCLPFLFILFVPLFVKNHDNVSKKTVG